MLKKLTTIIILMLSSISLMAQEDDTVILHIAPYQQNCVGVAPQDCMIVRFEDEDRPYYFYDSIDGFDYEEGFEYTLEVSVTQLEDVPADASSLQYELVEIIAQYPAHITGKVWELQSLNAEEIEDPTRYTLIITDEGLAIKADCNQVVANLTMNPFDIETTISTLAMCPEDSLEADYLAGLNSANMMTVENGILILITEEGELRFAPPSIEGIEWTLTRYLAPSAMMEMGIGTTYTLLIEDYQASMTVACNQAGADVEMNGVVISFSEIESTEALCENAVLAGMYPPESAVYSLNESGNLILEDNMGQLYEFSSDEG